MLGLRLLCLRSCCCLRLGAGSGLILLLLAHDLLLLELLLALLLHGSALVLHLLLTLTLQVLHLVLLPGALLRVLLLTAALHLALPALLEVALYGSAVLLRAIDVLLAHRRRLLGRGLRRLANARNARGRLPGLDRRRGRRGGDDFTVRGRRRSRHRLHGRLSRNRRPL